MSRSAFIVSDLLTLMAASKQYPKAFVGVGLKPVTFYCMGSLMADNKAFEMLRADFQRARTGEKFLLLYPDASTVCAARWEQADPVCSGCTKPVRLHT